MKFLITFFTTCIFFSSSEDESTARSSSMTSTMSSTFTTSPGSTVPPFSHCGTANKTDPIVNLYSSPSQTFFFNAPFDINYSSFFKLKHPEFRRVAYKVDVEKSAESGVKISKVKGILKVDDQTGTIPIEYVPFVYNKENFLNDSITVEWVNIPEDASPDSNDECFPVWFDKAITPKNLTLEVAYNP